jgi:predicted TIM-barrel enzyme
VIAGTGVSVENAERMLSLADGVIMGTSIKFGRDTFKPVDPEKAAEFIRRAKDIRDRLQ